jgi:ornithine decarboxylase
MKVLGKKKWPIENKIAYYLSNGVFGFFISSLYYEYNLEKILSEGWIISPLQRNYHPATLYYSILWGPTCDSGDKILEGIFLPEIQTGDFIAIENIGAYSKSLETSFNGIPCSKPYYIVTPFDRRLY